MSELSQTGRPTQLAESKVAELIPTLELIKKAVEAGELDTEIAAASVKLREGLQRKSLDLFGIDSHPVVNGLLSCSG